MSDDEFSIESLMASIDGLAMAPTVNVEQAPVMIEGNVEEIATADQGWIDLRSGEEEEAPAAGLPRRVAVIEALDAEGEVLQADDEGWDALEDGEEVFTAAATRPRQVAVVAEEDANAEGSLLGNNQEPDAAVQVQFAADAGLALWHDARLPAVDARIDALLVEARNLSAILQGYNVNLTFPERQVLDELWTSPRNHLGRREPPLHVMCRVFGPAVLLDWRYHWAHDPDGDKYMMNCDCDILCNKGLLTSKYLAISNIIFDSSVRGNLGMTYTWVRCDAATIDAIREHFLHTSGWPLCRWMFDGGVFSSSIDDPKKVHVHATNVIMEGELVESWDGPLTQFRSKVTGLSFRGNAIFRAKHYCPVAPYGSTPDAIDRSTFGGARLGTTLIALQIRGCVGGMCMS